MYRALRFSSGVIARSSLLASAYPRACRSCSGVCCALSLFSPEAEMTPPPAMADKIRPAQDGAPMSIGTKRIAREKSQFALEEATRNFIFSAIF